MTEFDIDVCQDCYYAHHYGFHSEEREATELEIVHHTHAVENTWHRREVMGLEFFTDGLGRVMVREWFAGESDQRCEGGEPLSRIADTPFDLFDNTDANTYEGLTSFTWSSCDGCGCRLGGSRFRLRVQMREATT